VPLHQYRCTKGHEFERLFLTFSEAEAESESTLCDICRKAKATRQISAPGLPIIYGEGAHRPAASGKSSYKTVDAEKFIKDENISVQTPLGERVGRKQFEQTVVENRRSKKK
jgi:hypothetical protein